MFPLTSFYSHIGTCLSLPLLHIRWWVTASFSVFSVSPHFFQFRLFTNSHFSILFWQKSSVMSYLLRVSCADTCWIAMSFSRKQPARLMIWWNRSILCRREYLLFVWSCAVFSSAVASPQASNRMRFHFCFFPFLMASAQTGHWWFSGRADALQDSCQCFFLTFLSFLSPFYCCFCIFVNIKRGGLKKAKRKLAVSWRTQPLENADSLVFFIQYICNVFCPKVAKISTMDSERKHKNGIDAFFFLSTIFDC